ncbi:hypothetical protein BCR43DRAFT_490461 [Syncephalastrum racemosum]|uniref:Uncharacterized protein n=1 Tax=Syncephalastrum racemosum TaxID=13706 RepID=A0A1X2HG16_SYNRA|nr:hypothetical protein BCR43DRAFT_490461 [Syncephalastrum racemosum]
MDLPSTDPFSASYTLSENTVPITPTGKQPIYHSKRSRTATGLFDSSNSPSPSSKRPALLKHLALPTTAGIADGKTPPRETMTPSLHNEKQTPNRSSPSMTPTKDTPTRPSNKKRNTSLKGGRRRHEDDKSSPSTASLFQTCQSIWSKNKSDTTQTNMVDYDQVKHVSELLRIRLTQAKYRAFALLEASKSHLLDDEDRQELYESMLPPQPNLIPPVRLSSKRHHASAIVVGSSRNLKFPPDNSNALQQKRRRRLGPSAEEKLKIALVENPQGKLSVTFAPSSHARPRNRKVNPSKPRRTQNPVALAPIQQEDGSKVYVCEPCNKKYKNRNGLQYHLERCKFRSSNTITEEDDDETHASDKLNSSSDDNSQVDVNCVCDNPHENRGHLMQCEECKMWLHLNCVDSVFRCPRCRAKRRDQENDDEEVDELIDSDKEDDLPALITASSTPLHPDHHATTSTTSSALTASTASTAAHLHQKDAQRQQNITTGDHTADDNAEKTSSPTEESEHSLPLQQLPTTPAAAAAVAAAAAGTPPAGSVSTPPEASKSFNVVGGEDPLWGSPQHLLSESWSQHAHTEDEPSSSLEISDLGIFQAPSLLYSDSTMLDDEAMPMSDLVPTEHDDFSPWFQFANFDSDFRCDEP